MFACMYVDIYSFCFEDLLRCDVAIHTCNQLVDQCSAASLSTCSTMCSAMVNEMSTPTRVLQTDRPAPLHERMHVCINV